MFTQANLDEGAEEMFRQFFSVSLEGFFEDQFNKLTNNYFIDCVCRHCGQYIKYISLRALLIHAMDCSKYKLQMEQTQNISLEQVEVIEIPQMQSQDKNILNALAELKSVVLEEDEESDEEESCTNIQQDHIVQSITQVQDKQCMAIEQFNQDDFKKQIMKATGFSQQNTNRFLTYIHDGRSVRSSTYDKAIETKQNLYELVKTYWKIHGIQDPRPKISEKQFAKQKIPKISQVMHRPDFFKSIGFIEIKNLKLQLQKKKIKFQFNIQFMIIQKLQLKQKISFCRSTSFAINAQVKTKANNQNKNTYKAKHSIIKNRIFKNYNYLTVYTQILVLFFTGADINDLPLLTQEMLQKNIYHYTPQKTKQDRIFSLHPDDHQKLQELFKRLKTKKLITNQSNLALGDNPQTIKIRFYEEIKNGPNPLLTFRSIKACRACEIFNYQGKECLTSSEIKEFFGHNQLCTTMKYLTEYSKIYHVTQQPFSCPSTGKFINQIQLK